MTIKDRLARLGHGVNARYAMVCSKRASSVPSAIELMMFSDDSEAGASVGSAAVNGAGAPRVETGLAGPRVVDGRGGILQEGGDDD